MFCYFRFVPSEDIFAKPTKNPSNKCFYEENESYKEKIKESMDIIGQKSEEIEKLQRTSAASTDPTLLNERNNEIAQLKEQVEAKEKQIAETAAKSKHHETAITEINSQVLGFEAELRAKEDMIRCLQVIYRIF